MPARDGGDVAPVLAVSTTTRTRTAGSSAPAATRATGSWCSSGSTVAAAPSRRSTRSTPAPSAAASASVTLRDGRPVVFAAHGSHASYLRAGTRDRMWPDPNDEADGRGRSSRPRLVEITRDSPAWMRRSTPWGDSRGRWWVPPEQDSPPGPAFQPAAGTPRRSPPAPGPARPACDAVGECDAPREGADGRARSCSRSSVLAMARSRSYGRPRTVTRRFDAPSRYGNPVCFGTRASNRYTLGPAMRPEPVACTRTARPTQPEPSPPESASAAHRPARRSSPIARRVLRSPSTRPENRSAVPLRTNALVDGSERHPGPNTDGVVERRRRPAQRSFVERACTRPQQSRLGSGRKRDI